MTTKRMLDELDAAIGLGNEFKFDTTGLLNISEEIKKREYALGDNKNAGKLKSQALDAAKSCGYADHTKVLNAAEEIYNWIVKE